MVCVYCSRCGKVIREGFKMNDNVVHLKEVMPYGSKYDGMLLQIDLCTECADAIIDGNWKHPVVG